MRGRPIRMADFSGGLNSRDANYQIAPNQARDCLNVVSTPDGALLKRTGTQFVNNSLSNPQSAFVATFGGVEKVLVADGPSAINTSIFRVINQVGTEDHQATIPNGQTGVGWSFAQAPAVSGQGPVFGVNGSTPIFHTGTGTGIWTPTTGTMPVGRYLLSAGNRLYQAGIVNQITSAGTISSGYTPTGAGAALSDPGSVVAFSEPGDPRTWTDFVALDPGDGDTITGISTVGPYLIVTKRRKTFVIYDFDTGANRRLTANLGCVSHRSMAEAGPSTTTEEGLQGLFFLSSDLSVCVTDGQRVRRVSDLIEPTLRRIDAEQLTTANGVVHDNRYYLTIPVGATTIPNLTLDLDLRNGSWWPSTMKSRQWLRWKRTRALELHRIGEAGNPATTGGLVGLMWSSGQTYDDQAEGYSAYWKGPHLAWDAPYIRKRLRQIRIDGNGRVHLSIAKDFRDPPLTERMDIFGVGDAIATSGTFGGTGTFGDSGTFGSMSIGAINQARLKQRQRVARAFSFQFSSTPGDLGVWEIDSLTPIIDQRTD